MMERNSFGGIVSMTGEPKEEENIINQKHADSTYDLYSYNNIIII